MAAAYAKSHALTLVSNAGKLVIVTTFVGKSSIILSIVDWCAEEHHCSSLLFIALLLRDPL